STFRYDPARMSGAVAVARRGWDLLTRMSAVVRMTAAGAAGLGPRLPPGSIGPSAVAKLGGESFYRKRFRRYRPIFKVIWNQHLTICVVGFERARRLLAAHSDALAPMTIDIDAFVPYGFMRKMDPEPHVRYRGLFTAALRVDPAVTWERELRNLIRD